MVQAPDISTNHPDLPQALVLLNEMSTSAQHVASLVDSMIQKVHSGELSTDQGLSFLEMKYNMLLSYLINITYVILRKCSGEKIEGDPCIDRLVEIRTVLEKIRPIDRKLKYQIDKLVKTAVTGNVDGLSTLKPKVGHFETKSDDESDSGSDEEQEKSAEKSGKGVLYVPPKISAVYFPDGSITEKNKRNQERSKKMALSASIMKDLQEEYLDTPVEVVQTSNAQQILTKRQKQIEEYEEEYMTRLPVTKADKHRSRQLTTMGTLANEVVDFGPSPSASSKKRKRLSKSKGKSFKKKRHH